MKLQFIEIENISKHVKKIYLNRPEKRNALCNPLRQELFSSLEDLDNDPEVKAIIVAGKMILEKKCLLFRPAKCKFLVVWIRRRFL